MYTSLYYTFFTSRSDFTEAYSFYLRSRGGGWASTGIINGFVALGRIIPGPGCLGGRNLSRSSWSDGGW